MQWKVGVAGAAFLGVIGVAGVASVAGHGPDARRAAWQAEYRPPATIPFPSENAYTPAKAELGRRLFFDPILSGDRDRSCGTCHLPDLAWGDGRARAASRGPGAMDLRTPTLLNVAWQDGPLGWDGKFGTLEAVAAMPITAAGNMNLPIPQALDRLAADPGYAEAFAAAFTDPAITRDRLEAALATFQRTIVSGTGPFDRWIAGDETAIPETAKRGFDLFNGRAGCAGCHSGWSFTDNSFHDIGVGRGGDLGRGRILRSSVALRHAFKTPTLRDAARRAPYMHDGSVPTLEAVIDLYDRGGIDRPSRSRLIRPLHLKAAERADLLAFLQTLSATADRDVTTAVFSPAAPTP
ncbi:cytochrome c peroxidase [Methylobacterium sp. NEAU 140]|uniref:cytochrome-c peroxidase n=1 Tax=Methylobacterium sp. NEAU 140 TaxID=3064945 RepID=UPI0027375260|nr:cytochrome c peroxidase [Methylobacterium sp. NEAU 140]MDP4023309.1 cytochrome c peroxidase [Methylobacterium sp. NEAU 140]